MVSSNGHIFMRIFFRIVVIALGMTFLLCAVAEEDGKQVALIFELRSGFGGNFTVLVDGREIIRDVTISDNIPNIAKKYELRTDAGYKNIEIIMVEGGERRHFSQSLRIETDMVVGVTSLRPTFKEAVIALTLSRQSIYYNVPSVLVPSK